MGRHRPWAHAVFHHYRRRFGRQYGSAREMEHRQRIFVHNMRYGHGGGSWGRPPPFWGHGGLRGATPTPRFVHSKNRAALSYSLALNHLADRTPQEMAALRGRRRSGDPNHGLPFPAEHYTGIILPESLDWRMYGKEGPGTAGSMESPHLLPRFPFTPHRLPRCPQARSPP